MNDPLDLEQIDSSVLYDLFYESGSKLGGALIEQERKARNEGKIDLLKSLMREEYDLLDKRDGVKSDDRDAQIACKKAWDNRLRELRDNA
ncbi:MAG: hypothetical protein ACLTUD_09585 [Bifidobacterium catenulatum]